MPRREREAGPGTASQPLHVGEAAGERNPSVSCSGLWAAVCPQTGTSLLFKNTSFTGYHMGEPGKHYAEGKKPDTEGYVVQESIYMKCPEETNPSRQKGDEGLPGAGGG